MTIGFIGLGIMGSRMATNLAKEQFKVVVHNRSKGKAVGLFSTGVTWKDSPARVAKSCDVLFTMLSTPAVVESVALGKEGFLPAMKKGALWVDCTTVNSMFSRTMASKASEFGVRFLDAPVAGSKGPAERGELVFLVGGEAADVEECTPLFEAMGRKYVHVGPHGQGSAMKMAVNLFLGVGMYAFSEALILGEAEGIPQSILFDTFSSIPLLAPWVTFKRSKIESGDYTPEFPLQWAHKDLQLASATAAEHTVPLPGVNFIKELYNLARKSGLAEHDLAAIYTYLKGE